MTERHRILLVNFSPKDAERLLKEGYNAEVGYIGPLSHSNDKPLIPYWFPRPPYEYEVFVYNSVATNPTVIIGNEKTRNLAEEAAMLEALDSPKVKIAFTGGSVGVLKTLFLAGLPYLAVVEAHAGVSEYLPVKLYDMGLPDVHKAIADLAKRIRVPVMEYIAPIRSKEPHWLYPQVSLQTRNGDSVAGYGTRAVEKQPRTVEYIFVPQLDNNAEALVSLLNAVVKTRPELFPDRKDLDWITSGEFAFAEEKAIDAEISVKIEALRTFIEGKEEEKRQARERYGFIRDVLTAEEDAGDSQARLSARVKLVLEFIGFDVEDIDAKIKGVIRKEDFWTKDRDFLAITEITATKNKNPKSKEYNDLLGRMTTIFKRRDLVPEASNIVGLLIINHDLETHPNQRPRLYTGGMEEIIEAAKDQQIGLLSTVELYRIAMAVKEKGLSKEKARALIKQPGRIEIAGLRT